MEDLLELEVDGSRFCGEKPQGKPCWHQAEGLDFPEQRLHELELYTAQKCTDTELWWIVRRELSSKFQCPGHASGVLCSEAECEADGTTYSPLEMDLGNSSNRE